MEDSDVDDDDDDSAEESDVESDPERTTPETGFGSEEVSGNEESPSQPPRDDSFNSTQSNYSADNLSFDDAAMEK